MAALRLPDPPLTDGTVTLRPLGMGDVDGMVEGCRDPVTRRYTSRIPDPYGPEDAREFIGLQPQMLAEGTELTLAIADAQTDELLGVIGLHHVDLALGRALCGYWVGPRHRRRGAGTRALRLLAGWATDGLGLEQLALYTDVENVPSQRVAEEAGFARAGTARHPIGGQERDALLFERG